MNGSNIPQKLTRVLGCVRTVEQILIPNKFGTIFTLTMGPFPPIVEHLCTLQNLLSEPSSVKGRGDARIVPSGRESSEPHFVWVVQYYNGHL